MSDSHPFSPLFVADLYVASVRWQYAKTMPDWPHEYTVKAWRPELALEFEMFCQRIIDSGSAEPWPSPPARAIYHNHYLVMGDWKYWAMGPLGDADAVSDKTVLNRERLAPETVGGRSSATAGCANGRPGSD